MKYSIQEQIACVKSVRDEAAKERDKLQARPIKGSTHRIKKLIRRVMILNEVVGRLTVSQEVQNDAKLINDKLLNT